jgi:dihydroorotate dehydrogenase
LYSKNTSSLFIEQKTSIKVGLSSPAMYRLLRALLFLTPPEWAHRFSMNALQFICYLGFTPVVRSVFFPRKATAVTFNGLTFPSVVGLGAGFDKNARYLRVLDALGFGHVEIGTVTPLAQPGNEKPRLFRLPKDKALINRMGFNNDGVAVISSRLAEWKRYQGRNNKSRMLIGGNIGKNKATPNELAWKDYEACFNELHPYVDYFVINVSSPNTPGLRELQEKEALKKILTHLQTINHAKEIRRPLLLKIAPDLALDQLDDIIALSMEINLDGIVVANTTISRSNLKTKAARLEEIGGGGLSGLPLLMKSTSLVKYIAEKTKGRMPIIASGGILSGIEAKEKLAAGATLVQVWTGFIYTGPSIVKRICKSL